MLDMPFILQCPKVAVNSVQMQWSGYSFEIGCVPPNGRVRVAQGKIVFVAPTKPLLSQQVEACYWKMGVSRVLPVLSCCIIRPAS